MSSLSIMATFVRKYFARAFNNSEAVDGTWWAALDAQLADQVAQGNQLKARLEAISTAAGSLRYNLTQQVPFTATLNQTAFTVGAYDNVKDLVEAFTNNGSGSFQYRIPDSQVVKTSSTVITLPAQPAGALVTICIRSVGNGTSQLASTTVGQGSALVGFSNPNGLSSSVNVEAALAELFSDINSSSFLGGILTLTGYLKANGANPLTGNLPAGGNKITGLGAGTSGTNDAARMADITSAALQATLAAYLSANYLPLTTGQISASFLPGLAGDVVAAAGTNLTSINKGVITSDRFSQLNGGALQAGRNAVINGAMLVPSQSGYNGVSSGVYGYGAIELMKGALIGTTVSGTFQQGSMVKSLGPTAITAMWSGVTITGSGVVSWLYFVESRDSIRFTQGTASCGCWLLQSTGGPLNASIQVYKANSPDDFSALTALGSTLVTLVSGVPTWVKLEGIVMGDCSSGIQILVNIASGSCSGQTFHMAELQLEPGSFCTPCEYESVAITSQRVLRHIERLGPNQSSTTPILNGMATSTTAAIFAVRYAKKRTVPSLAVIGTAANITPTNGSGTPIAATSVAATLISPDHSNLSVVVASGLTIGQASMLQISDTTTYIAIDCRF